MNDVADVADAGVICELQELAVATPCFIIFEEHVRHNLRMTALACGGVDRLMPHIKTHRAPWIVKLLLGQGVAQFKCATPAEAEMALAAGARHVTWAYPSANGVLVERFVRAARQYPEAELVGLVDNPAGLERFALALRNAPPNLRLRVDLDPGMGRTGAVMAEPALALARALEELGRFAGWHIYDGHIKGPRPQRQREVMVLTELVNRLQSRLRERGCSGDVIAGGSYTFDLWPAEVARYVGPGSFVYSSAEHDIELTHLNWRPAAFVLSTVLSTHAGTATLDAGSKAISPDKPVAERFRWNGGIRLMSEEHSVVAAERLAVGQRVLLLPQHACTTAYLYAEALVKTVEGSFERRPQMGSRR